MRAKPDCDRAAFERIRGGSAAGASWLGALRTLTADLRVSPSLAAAGFQEMRPALTLAFASRGDAITGINRADTASVKRYSILRDPARDGNSI